MGTVGPCRGEFSLRIVLPPLFFSITGSVASCFHFGRNELARARTRRGNVMNVLPGQLL